MSKVLKQLFEEEIAEAERSRANLRLVPPPPPPAFPPIRMKVVSLSKKKAKVTSFQIVMATLVLAIGSLATYRQMHRPMMVSESSVAEKAPTAQAPPKDVVESAQDPEDIRLNHEAVQLFRKEKYQEALPLFVELLSKYPQNPALLVNLGMVQLKLRDTVAASTNFSEALRLMSIHPNPKKNLLVSTAYNNLGAASMMEQEWDQAINYFQKSVLLSPDYIEGRLNLAKAFEKTGHPADAVREYEAYLANPQANSAIKAVIQKRLAKISSFSDYFSIESSESDPDDLEEK